MPRTSGVREKYWKRGNEILATSKYLREMHFVKHGMSSCESELMLEACVDDYASLCDWEDRVRKVTAHYDVVDSSSFKTLKNDLLRLINTHKVEVHIQEIYWLPVSHFCLLRQCGTIQLYRQMDGATCGAPVDFNVGLEKIQEVEDDFIDDENEPCKKKQKNT
jgi:hypothetical protein